MATVIIDENTPHDGTAFEAFDESRTALIRQAAAETVLSSGSNPSSIMGEVNSFRQGVEITTETYRFLGAGPKIWAGNIKGYTTVRTIGQTISFTEALDDKSYLDKQTFNPVEYVSNEDYPHPIYLNDGPGQNRETVVQTFVLPFWAMDNENAGDPHAFAARGSVEDGNPVVDEPNTSTNRIEQFISFNDTGILPFLDEGGAYWGQAVPTSIVVEGYTNDGTEVAFVPFDDIGNEKLVNNLSTTNNTLLSLLRSSSSIDLDEDIRETYGVKSATAGSDVYGPGQAQYGTDSIAYIGFYRGS